MDELFDEEEAMFGVVPGNMMFPASGLAWQMFAQTGMPGFYLLYRDIEHGNERSPLD